MDSNSISFTCLRTIARYHLAIPPYGVPYSPDKNYPGNSRDRYELPMERRQDWIKRWSYVKDDLERRKLALRDVKGFAKKSFPILKGASRDVLDDILEEYKNQITELEVTESFTREWISMMDSKQSVVMAKQSIRESRISIRESKRVKLSECFMLIPGKKIWLTIFAQSHDPSLCIPSHLSCVIHLRHEPAADKLHWK